jgi:hypothetical protein
MSPVLRIHPSMANPTRMKVKKTKAFSEELFLDNKIMISEAAPT